MLSEQQINDANEYGEWMRLAVHERSLPSGDRVRASASCYAIAQDHHHAIVLLLGANLYASCFALVRVAFEAYVRGEWLSLCATDAEVERFLRGDEPPKIDALLAAIESTDGFKQGGLSLVKKQSWRSLCAYTHTGGLHVQRWNTADGVEPNYSIEELIEVLRFADIIATLAVLGVLRLANDNAASGALLERLQARMG